MFDIKHHIASLAAVFLALALGIIIGSSMVGSDAITQQQKSMIEGIEKEFNILREENKQNADALIQAQKVMSYQQQFNQQVFPCWCAINFKGGRLLWWILITARNMKDFPMFSVLQGLKYSRLQLSIYPY